MKKILVLAAVLSLAAGLFAEPAFSGYSGGKINYSTNEQDTENYNPDLKLQAFFQGQFNFSQNMWGRLEFSIDTDDFLSKELFHKTAASFEIDELSLIFKSNTDTGANVYFF